mgnify:CR=1 FL=1
MRHLRAFGLTNDDGISGSDKLEFITGCLLVRFLCLKHKLVILIVNTECLRTVDVVNLDISAVTIDFCIVVRLVHHCDKCVCTSATFV